VNEVAGFDVADLTEQSLAVGLESDAIAPSEYAERAESLETDGEPGEAVPPSEQVLFESLARALDQLVESASGFTELGHAGDANPVGEPVQV
jgi:hypothetical protein